MTTTTTKHREAQMREMECAEVMSRIAPVLADYLDHGDVSARGGRFDELYLLAWAVEQEQNHVPALEDRQAQIIDAVVSVYTDVSKGRIVGEAQQREAHEKALVQIDALPRSSAARDNVLDRLVKTRAEIRKGDIRTRNRRGPRETANIVVGQLRPLFFNVGVKWFGLDRLGTVVARDAMRGLYRRAAQRRGLKRGPRTMQALVRVLVDAMLDSFLDDDLLALAQDAIHGAIERQLLRDSGVPAGALAAAPSVPSI